MLFPHQDLNTQKSEEHPTREMGPSKDPVNAPGYMWQKHISMSPPRTHRDSIAVPAV